MIKQIAAGAEYSLALTNDGKVYSWGQGKYISFFNNIKINNNNYYFFNFI